MRKACKSASLFIVVPHVYDIRDSYAKANRGCRGTFWQLKHDINTVLFFLVLVFFSPAQSVPTFLPLRRSNDQTVWPYKHLSTIACVAAREARIALTFPEQPSEVDHTLNHSSPNKTIKTKSNALLSRCCEIYFLVERNTTGQLRKCYFFSR